jgi:hypothetical protein
MAISFPVAYYEMISEIPFVFVCYINILEKMDKSKGPLLLPLANVLKHETSIENCFLTISTSCIYDSLSLEYLSIWMPSFPAL